MKTLSKFNQQMVEKVAWKHSEELPIFQWTKRGIAGELVKRKKICYSIMFGIFFMFTLFVTYFAILSFEKGDSIFSVSILYAITYIIFVIPGMLGTYFLFHCGMVYSYRITEQHIEVAFWRDELAIIKQALKIPIGILIAFLLVFMVIEPSAILVGLSGMVGVGAMAGATLYSGSYAKTNLQYKQVDAPLDSIVYKQIDTTRNLIGMEAKVKLGTKKIREVNRAFTVFCTAENFQAIESFLKEKNTNPELEVVYGEMYKNNYKKENN